MTTITIGRIMTNKEDTYRAILREALAPLRWRGYAVGSYAVEVCEGLILRIELGARDVSVLDQADDLLRRIVFANHDAMVAFTGGYDEEAHEGVGWFALTPVRNVGYGEGEYTGKLRSDVASELSIGRWDAMLLRRYDELLRRLAAQNQWCLYPGRRSLDGSRPAEAA